MYVCTLLSYLLLLTRIYQTYSDFLHLYSSIDFGLSWDMFYMQLRKPLVNIVILSEPL